MSLIQPDLTEVWGQICVNGKLTAAGGAAVSALDRGLLYGDGIFETIRVYQGTPFMLDAHLARMVEGCAVISLRPPDMRDIARWVDQVLTANGLSDAYLRITVARGATGRLWHDITNAVPTVVIMSKPMVPHDFGDGLRLAVSSFRSDEVSPLSRAKHTGILWKILARAEAKHVGADDVLLLNTKGQIAEATSANIFWVHGGMLCTPSLDCGLLAGITRALVIEIARENGIEVTEAGFTFDDLLSAEEVFLTSSTWELAPVRSLGDTRFGAIAPGPLTNRLLELYRERVPRQS